ncbi:RAB geranylgeranyl transferase alpha subunit 1 [Artemisia annua]|uniref:Geranylgeranyl transferase type-2 subunit alpha n=1 Tax=Artemisia annua TaxID=35608 RepID=A0A2U1MCZ6_ARTAN|nr:RAB geranylgeranyl transferase alpha subunit 1 [Artemisia annua]
MHGRPRKPSTPVDENASSLKANKIKSLQSQFLHYHHNKIYTEEALKINEKLIEANPEFMTAWNYRKLAFQDKVQALIDEELRVVENALRKNFKSYGAWHHRKWVVSKGNTSTEREIGLLNKFQQLDTRNFHAWNYRRSIAELKNIPDEKELKYTTDMIETNFSNYSAWHNRSVLLSHLMEKKVEGYLQKEIILKEEYEFVRNAVFTDPDDQSGWFYHLWLLDQTVKLDMPTLVSSWPPHGSDINQVTFPIILYFDEPVEGVSSHTVTVQTENDIFKNVTWNPLSTNKFKCAQAWMTHLSIPHEEVNSSKKVQVKVSSEMSDGIISLCGVTSSRPWSFGFTVSVCQNPQPAEGQNRRLSYADESFCIVDTNSNSAGLLTSYFESKTSDYEQSTSSKWKSEMIATEIDQYRDMLTWAESKKIGKLTLARLLTAYDAVMSTGAPDTANVEEVLQLYTELMKLDPAHNQYYKDEYSLALLKQVTSNKESLLKYCWQYKESTSSNITDSLCLRLNNLSLSRIGSFERLLWVQSLDLSHNELHSIEGLEALQLLSCLNLSHNKLSSFMALDPLRFLKSSLQVLDISYNEIGAHTIDTRRYLCSSPMSHTLDYDAKFEEFANGDANLVNFWDAYSIFGGLNLTQLDIVGNVAVDERFALFLAKLLPGLKWLDGEELN